MSYCAYDPTNKQYLGDVASIGGWAMFRAWALEQDALIIKLFVEQGSTANPQALATALHLVRSADKDVDSVRQQLAFIAGNTPHALVLSNGTEDML